MVRQDGLSDRLAKAADLVGVACSLNFRIRFVAPLRERACRFALANCAFVLYTQTPLERRDQSQPRQPVKLGRALLSSRERETGLAQSRRQSADLASSSINPLSTKRNSRLQQCVS